MISFKMLRLRLAVGNIDMFQKFISVKIYLNTKWKIELKNFKQWNNPSFLNQDQISWRVANS